MYQLKKVRISGFKYYRTIFLVLVQSQGEPRKAFYLTKKLKESGIENDKSIKEGRQTMAYLTSTR